MGARFNDICIGYLVCLLLTLSSGDTNNGTSTIVGGGSEKDTLLDGIRNSLRWLEGFLELKEADKIYEYEKYPGESDLYWNHHTKQVQENLKKLQQLKYNDNGGTVAAAANFLSAHRNDQQGVRSNTGIQGNNQMNPQYGNQQNAYSQNQGPQRTNQNSYTGLNQGHHTNGNSRQVPVQHNQYSGSNRNTYNAGSNQGQYLKSNSAPNQNPRSDNARYSPQTSQQTATANMQYSSPITYQNTQPNRPQNLESSSDQYTGHYHPLNKVHGYSKNGAAVSGQQLNIGKPHSLGGNVQSAQGVAPTVNPSQYGSKRNAAQYIPKLQTSGTSVHNGYYPSDQNQNTNSFPSSNFGINESNQNVASGSSRLGYTGTSTADQGYGYNTANNQQTPSQGHGISGSLGIQGSQSSHPNPYQYQSSPNVGFPSSYAETGRRQSSTDNTKHSNYDYDYNNDNYNFPDFDSTDSFYDNPEYKKTSNGAYDSMNNGYGSNRRGNTFPSDSANNDADDYYNFGKDSPYQYPDWSSKTQNFDYNPSFDFKDSSHSSSDNRNGYGMRKSEFPNYQNSYPSKSSTSDFQYPSEGYNYGSNAYPTSQNQMPSSYRAVGTSDTPRSSYGSRKSSSPYQSPSAGASNAPSSGYGSQKSTSPYRPSPMGASKTPHSSYGSQKSASLYQPPSGYGSNMGNYRPSNYTSSYGQTFNNNQYNRHNGRNGAYPSPTGAPNTAYGQGTTYTNQLKNNGQAISRNMNGGNQRQYGYRPNTNQQVYNNNLGASGQYPRQSNVNQRLTGMQNQLSQGNNQARIVQQPQQGQQIPQQNHGQQQQLQQQQQQQQQQRVIDQKSQQHATQEVQPERQEQQSQPIINQNINANANQNANQQVINVPQTPPDGLTTIQGDQQVTPTPSVVPQETSQNNIQTKTPTGKNVNFSQLNERRVDQRQLHHSKYTVNSNGNGRHNMYGADAQRQINPLGNGMRNLRGPNEDRQYIQGNKKHAGTRFPVRAPNTKSQVTQQLPQPAVNNRHSPPVHGDPPGSRTFQGGITQRTANQGLVQRASETPARVNVRSKSQGVLNKRLARGKKLQGIPLQQIQNPQGPGPVGQGPQTPPSQMQLSQAQLPQNGRSSQVQRPLVQRAKKQRLHATRQRAQSTTTFALNNAALNSIGQDRPKHRTPPKIVNTGPKTRQQLLIEFENAKHLLDSSMPEIKVPLLQQLLAMESKNNIISSNINNVKIIPPISPAEFNEGESLNLETDRDDEVVKTTNRNAQGSEGTDPVKKTKNQVEEEQEISGEVFREEEAPVSLMQVSGLEVEETHLVPVASHVEPKIAISPVNVLPVIPDDDESRDEEAIGNNQEPLGPPELPPSVPETNVIVPNIGETVEGAEIQESMEVQGSEGQGGQDVSRSDDLEGDELESQSPDQVFRMPEGKELTPPQTHEKMRKSFKLGGAFKKTEKSDKHTDMQMKREKTRRKLPGLHFGIKRQKPVSTTLPILQRFLHSAGDAARLADNSYERYSMKSSDFGKYE